MEIKFELTTKERLDQFLTKEIDGFSREKIKQHIKLGNVLVNNKQVIKPGYVLQGNGNVIFNEIKDEENEILIPWEEGEMPEIIFENENYFVINKPSGLVVHPGSNNTEFTLANILISKRDELSMLNTIRPGIVHRLDKNTSGLLVIAKNDKFHNYIAKQFENGEVEKKYRLITNGKYKNSNGIIKVPIGRDPANRKLMKAQIDNSKMAISKFQVIESFKNNEYVEFNILTGRTHQIRVHSKFLDAPVLNDPEYGSNTFDPEFGQFLHSTELTFINLSGEKVTYKSNLPKEFKEKLKELRDDKHS